MKIDVTITQDELRELVAVKLNVNVNCVGMVTVERPDASTVEPNPWYPDDSGEWIEYDVTSSIKPCAKHKIQWLLRSERDTKDYYYYYTDYPEGLDWDVNGPNTIVAYKLNP